MRLLDLHSHQRIVPQVLVIVEILVSQSQRAFIKVANLMANCWAAPWAIHKVSGVTASS